MDATLTFMAPATPPDASVEDFNITDLELVAAAAEAAPQQGEWRITMREWRICWEYLWETSRGSGWRDFHPSLSLFVETAFIQGHKSCACHMSYLNYRWDFEEWKQYKEVNGRVVATKWIRRVMVFEPRSAASAE